MRAWAIICFAVSAHAAPVSITLTADQVNAVCASQGGCGGGGVPPLVCVPPSVPNAAGTACETPSSGWNGTCPGFTKTLVVPLDWSAPTRMYTSSFGHFNPNDAVVITFTTGNVSSSGSLPRIAAAEYQSAPSARIARLSPTPCDFTTQPMFGANINGNSVTAIFAIGSGSGFGFYPVVPLNTTWYLNIRNDPGATCIENGACDLFVDLIKNGT